MSLKLKINDDIKTAMKAKQKDDLRALRAIKSMILLAETADGSTSELTEEQEIKMLQKAVKQRKESAQVYKEQGREDLAEVELVEVAVIEKYLPAQMGEEELQAKIAEIIAQVGAEGPKDMGKVMGAASKALAGQADGKSISTVVKSLLNK
ncbi:GatB/YqeY domain-containing protein [Persicobacter psychrovividus]|uniref:Aspartyl-tRNA amidotransferase subunit B n=1 Tax=Persicobacter psychrovividus TaxID=387638 RepID=A0ABM7VBC8_9BACT|nr:aspartyl-tRNA amidotransferase subunit B [Persicobacter psychrovividus]